MIKVKIPSEIKIGGHWVRIFYEDRLFDNHGKLGQSRLFENELALENKGIAESHKAHTLIHELIHHIDSVYNNYGLDEETTDALASGIHTLLVDLGIEFDWSDIPYI